MKRILDANQSERDAWVTLQVEKYVRNNDVVIDVGAGTSPYRHLFQGARYLSHDFGEYHGEKLGGGTGYAHIDIKSDITTIPVHDDF
jgi:hypothetical protein